MIHSSFKIINPSNSIDWNLPCFDVFNHISNIVALSHFRAPLDLKFFTNFWKFAVFEPSKIPCVRCPLPFTQFNAVALVYSSGSVIITGLNQLPLIKKAFLVIAKFIRNAFSSNFPIPSFNCKIHNVVASFHSKHSINLNLLPLINNLFIFDPSLFPAATFHVHDFIPLLHATVLIYFNGKIIVTGAKLCHLGMRLREGSCLASLRCSDEMCVIFHF